MADNRGGFIEQTAADLRDAFQYILLFAAEQAVSDSAEVGSEEAHPSEPLLLEAQIHTIEFVGLG